MRDLRISYRVPEDFLRVAATVAPDGGATAPRGVRRAPWPAAAIACAAGRLAAVAGAVAARLAGRPAASRSSRRTPCTTTWPGTARPTPTRRATSPAGSTS